jgi:general nucleoside transport system permease protein
LNVRSALAGPAIALVSLALTVVIAGGLLALGGYDPAAAGAALVRGAIGTPDAFYSITLVRAVPVMFTGLAVAIAFRSGILNIGAEGQLYAGAALGTAVGLAGGDLPAVVMLPAMLLASAVGGALWALVPALLKIHRGVSEVITTMLLNFVAIRMVGWLVRGPLQEHTGVYSQTDQIAVGARLPLVHEPFRLHWGFLVAVALGIGCWLLLRYSVTGFQLRALGASPRAAAISGRVDARRLTYGVFLASGALAGLAGGVEVAGVTYALYEGLSPGHGYTAIAAALLAGLHPIGVLATGTLFGAIGSGAAAMQRTAGIPAAWAQGVQALVILSVLAVDVGLKRVRARMAAAAPPEEQTPEPAPVPVATVAS